MKIQPEAQIESANFTMSEKSSPFGSDDLAPCSVLIASPAQVNHMAGITAEHFETSIRRYFNGFINLAHINPSGLRHKDYLLYIHPFHSIW